MMSEKGRAKVDSVKYIKDIVKALQKEQTSFPLKSVHLCNET